MASFHKDGKEVNFVAAATVPAGTLIQTAGQVGIANPKHDGSDYETGEMGVARVAAGTLVMIPNPDGVTATDGAVIAYIAATDKAAAAAGGDFDAGTCNAAESTATHLAVAINIGV